MKYLNATMIAMMDIKQFKKDLGLEHEQTKISRRLNRLAIEEFNNQESRD
jgi:hypothetical protein